MLKRLFGIGGLRAEAKAPEAPVTIRIYLGNPTNAVVLSLGGEDEIRFTPAEVRQLFAMLKVWRQTWLPSDGENDQK